MKTPTNRRSSRPPLSEPVDSLLADIAIRIQLSRTDYRKAEERYGALSEWIDRDGSPLAGRVDLVYPQGSIAIGATVASRLTMDEHDVDFVAQLALPPDTRPKRVLDLLYESIRGPRGSRYHGMAERRTRCVIVHYADKMHADVTPTIGRVGRRERESFLFHHRPEAPVEPERRLVANPYGFAEWFKRKTATDREFATLFEARARAYESSRMVAKADTEEMPDQEPTPLKSKAVIVLQLMKRWRNIRYEERDMRRPPSVMLAELIAHTSNGAATLSEELLRQARSMRDTMKSCQDAGRPIYVRNPVCAEDVLTDRWPESLGEQARFIADLDDLVAKLERLIAGCDLEEMRAIMANLFGEAPTGDAFQDYNRQVGATIRHGHSRHEPGTGRFVFPAVGIAAGMSTPAPARPTPKNTFFGEER